MQVRLVHVGRFSFITPAELGEQFKPDCTFTIRTMSPPSLSNGFKAQTEISEEKVWWKGVDVMQNDAPCFCFFTGMAEFIRQSLLKQGHSVSVEDRRPSGMPVPAFNLIAGTEFRGRQKEALLKMCAARGGVVICPTGFGKSFLVRIWARLFPKTKGIITAPSRTNARDLYRALEGSIEGLGFVGDGEYRPDRITVAVTHSISRCDPDVAWVLVDEAHAAIAPMHIKNLLMFRRAKFLAFTATPTGKSDGRDPYLQALFGPTLIEVEYDEAVASGNVVQLKVDFLAIRSGPDVSRYDNKAIKDKLGIWRNRARNEAIAARVRQEMEADHAAQILVMVDKTEHAFVLGQLLPEFALVHGSVDKARLDKLQKCGAYNPETQTPCDRKLLNKYQSEFTNGKLRYAIATGVWSKGVDFQDLNILVRADGLASDIHSGQIPGRLSRLGTNKDKGHGKLIDCIDFFSHDLLGRSIKRAAVCKKNKWEMNDEAVSLVRSARTLYYSRGRSSASLPNSDFTDDGDL